MPPPPPGASRLEVLLVKTYQGYNVRGTNKAGKDRATAVDSAPPLPPLPLLEVLNQEVLPAEFSVVSKVVDPLPVEEVPRVERIVRGVPFESMHTVSHNDKQKADSRWKSKHFQPYRQASEGGEPRRNPCSRSKCDNRQRGSSKKLLTGTRSLEHVIHFTGHVKDQLAYGMPTINRVCDTIYFQLLSYFEPGFNYNVSQGVSNSNFSVKMATLFSSSKVRA